MKKIFSLFAALTLSAGLWAETVITYTASQKLGDKLWSQLLGTYQHEFVGNNGTITIQGELSTIPEKVFSKSTYLQTIILPECVTSIGENAFLMCSSLQSIAMPKVTTIEHDAFKSCGSLSSIELPNVTTIGRQAFSLCTSLLSIELPKVVSIEHSAFLGSALQSVTFLSTSCTIDDFAFEGVGSAAKPATLVLPDNWTGTKPAQDGSWYGGYFTMPVSTTYLDENGEEQTVDAWEVKDASAAVTWGTAGETTWYVVKGTDVQLSKGAVCAGDVRLILADNAKLTATGGINVTETNSLTIYAQSTGTQMGQLSANGGSMIAGIGGGNSQPGNNITINGGTVEATGGGSAAGIGGGRFSSGSNITINGGTVEATGGSGAAGIGGGTSGAGSNITINGGTITANNGSYAAGIGGGNGGAGSNIIINGGTITANGGTYAAGIGGGRFASGSNITILAGTVTANGGSNAAGIGNGKDAQTDAFNIFVATSLQVKADNNNPPTTVITNTGADLASSLAGKQYVVTSEIDIPSIKAAAIEAVNAEIEETDNDNVKAIAENAATAINAATTEAEINALKDLAIAAIASAKAAYGDGEAAGYNTGYDEGEAAVRATLPTEGYEGPAVIITKGEKVLILFNPEKVEYKILEAD